MELEYGPIICTDEKHKGMIVMLDDFEYEDGKDCGIVYFGNPLFCSTYSLVPTNCLSNNISMYDIVSRINELKNKIASKCEKQQTDKLLIELDLVTTLFYEKHINTHALTKSGTRVFISHSSKDKGYANFLYADLRDAGCDPWLDEWDIVGGESIPSEIEKGIDNCDFLIILLSTASVDSPWVRAEWESSIWDEYNDKKVKIIPLLIEECSIPRFLKFKKYIDFRKDYSIGLQELLRSMEVLLSKQNR